MNAPRPPARLRPSALLIVLLLLPVGAQAQKLYKCEKDGKVIFSNTPCSGTPDSLQSSSPIQSTVTTLAGPGPGRIFSPDDKELLARIQRDYDGLMARCAEGDQEVCALLDCVLKADRSACARAEGRLAGNGWREVSRKAHRRQRQDPKLGTVTDREVEIVVECLPAHVERSVYWMDGGAYLRDGDKVKDAATGKELRKPGSRFKSFEEAARSACGK